MKEILREIGMITRCFESIANIEFKDYKLSKNQYIYLVRIAENPGIILERLSDYLKVEKSTASRVVKNLVENGFVAKHDEGSTGKKIGLTVTNKGDLAYMMLKNDEEYSNSVALRGLDKDDMKTLLFYLSRIRANIEPDWESVRKGFERPYPKVKWLELVDENKGYGRIVEYRDGHQEDFRSISYGWLEKYVSVEPDDIRLLENPIAEILQKGGYILMAEHEGKAIGTVALLKYDKNVYELAKLGVLESEQKKGVGKQLVLAALLKAYEAGAEKVVLFTTERLRSALKLYESFGFSVVDGFEQKYIEAELMMELRFR